FKTDIIKSFITSSYLLFIPSNKLDIPKFKSSKLNVGSIKKINLKNMIDKIDAIALVNLHKILKITKSKVKFTRKIAKYILKIPYVKFILNSLIKYSLLRVPTPPIK